MNNREPRILALCAGYGGLELAIQSLIGGNVVAFAEKDPYAARVFTSHNPEVPNLGDITETDWHDVRERYGPDVIGAGFPCTDISNAGPRTGISGERSGIWKNVAEAVGVIRPRLVFLENVSAIRSRGLDVVAQDLASVGYDLRWTCVRASDVGATHTRSRWFGLGKPAADTDHVGRDRGCRGFGQACGWAEPQDSSNAAPDPHLTGREVGGVESDRDQCQATE